MQTHIIECIGVRALRCDRGIGKHLIQVPGGDPRSVSIRRVLRRECFEFDRRSRGVPMRGTQFGRVERYTSFRTLWC
jgi:hypothetical protein